MKKLTKKIEETNLDKAFIIDQIKVISEDFKSDLKQVSEGVLMLTETMNRRFNDVDLELSQIKSVVLDIQYEKASRAEVLALAKRITKLEMANEKSRK
jgi:hypothetical protein